MPVNLLLRLKAICSGAFFSCFSRLFLRGCEHLMLILYETYSHVATTRESNTFTALLVIIRKDNLDFDLIQSEFRV